MKSYTLKEILNKYHFKYVSTITIVFFISSLFTFFVTLQFERVDLCRKVNYRFNDLNDVLARELILGSQETISFELGKIVRDFDLRSINAVNVIDRPQDDICSFFKIGDEFTASVRFGSRVLGRFSVKSKTFSFLNIKYLVLYLPLFLIVFVSYIFIHFLERVISSSIVGPLSEMLTQAQHVEPTGERFQYSGSTVELTNLKEKLNKMLFRLDEAAKENLSLVRSASIGELASQVAHDIRSPLEVLKSLKIDVEYLSENQRQRAYASIVRIEEIAHNLLKARKRSVRAIEEGEKSEELLSLLESILIEKKFEYSTYSDCEIKGHFDSESYGLFSKVNTGSFKVVISNMINNAIEALEFKRGYVAIRLFSNNKWNIIEIKDSGKGFPLELKDKIFSRGFTTKDSGNGLGLSGAASEIKSIGGMIDVESNINGGTVFKIFLPKIEIDDLFIKEINLYKFEKVIILDDDKNFHDLWREKINSCCIVESYYSVSDILRKYETIPIGTLFLSDFELMDEVNGLELIIRFNNISNCILVTARSEEIFIQDTCRKMGIKILSKSLINYVKINKSKPSIILIDDDRLIHLDWSSYCKEIGSLFIGFKSVDEFITKSSEIPKDSTVYIDSSLQDGLKGEVESEKLFDLGFTNLFITTGYESDSILKPTWIKSIYSKNPRKIF